MEICSNYLKQLDMKTLNAFKTFSLSITLIVLSAFSLFAGALEVNNVDSTNTSFQNKVWATISSMNDVPFLNQEGELVSNDAQLNKVLKALNIKTVQRAVPASRSEKLLKVYEFTTAQDKEILFHELSKLPALSSVEYAPEYKTLHTPNDYDNTISDYSLDLINAESAWDYSIGSASVSIAISDQNIDETHPELVNQVIYYDASNLSSSTHGTAVSIIAAGETNNELLQSHIGYNSSLAFYKMNYNEVLAASYAGHKVVNLSWTSGCEFSQYVQDIIDEVYENGTFIVAAAGNGSTCGSAESLVYPASCNHVFSVTSIGPNNNHERIEGNASSTHQHNAMVDLSAPGYDLTISPAPNWNIVASGTSYAAPHVTGTVGLLLDVNPCLTNDDIEWILKSSSFNTDALNPNYIGLIGEGRLDAGAAVELAAQFSVFELDPEVSVSCGQIGGDVIIDITGGNAPFNALWSNGSESLNLLNVPSGSYALTVTDAIGCTASLEVDVESFVPVLIEEQIQHVNCNGTATGAIDITIVEGTPDYTFEWIHGAITDDINELYAGTYRLKVTDGNGCESFASYEVLEPELIQAELMVDEPIFQDELSNLNLTVNGGMAPYSFDWNTGADSEDLYDVTEGFYEVTITDFNLCTTQINVTIDDLSSVGIDEISNHDVNIYPNPTNTIATVTWSNENLDQLTIVSASGQIVEKMDVAMVTKYETGELNPGIYFINLLENQSSVATRKLVVK